MQNKTIVTLLVVVCYLTACNNQANNRNKQDLTVASETNAEMIPDKITSDTSLSDLVLAFMSAGLMETLKQPGPFTVFAPTNEAFRKLPPGTFEGLMTKRKDDLSNIMSYHVVAGSVKTADLRDGEKLKTLAGEDLIVTMRNKKVLINGIQVIKQDLRAANGIVYSIGGLLFPQNQNAASY